MKCGLIPKKHLTVSRDSTTVYTACSELRRQQSLSERNHVHKLLLAGYDMDKNVIICIETNKRYVMDIEL